MIGDPTIKNLKERIASLSRPKKEDRSSWDYPTQELIEDDCFSVFSEPVPPLVQAAALVGERLAQQREPEGGGEGAIKLPVRVEKLDESPWFTIRDAAGNFIPTEVYGDEPQMRQIATALNATAGAGAGAQAAVSAAFEKAAEICDKAGDEAITRAEVRQREGARICANLIRVHEQMRRKE